MVQLNKSSRMNILSQFIMVINVSTGFFIYIGHFKDSKIKRKIFKGTSQLFCLRDTYFQLCSYKMRVDLFNNNKGSLYVNTPSKLIQV